MYVDNNTKGGLAIVENKALWITARAERNPSGFYRNKKKGSGILLKICLAVF
jgi:hypothetical protein